MRHDLQISVCHDAYFVILPVFKYYHGHFWMSFDVLNMKKIRSVNPTLDKEALRLVAGIVILLPIFAYQHWL